MPGKATSRRPLSNSNLLGHGRRVITRRYLLSSAFSSFVGMAVSGRAAVAAFDRSSLEGRITKIEEASGGRLGVAILETTTAIRIGHRSDERFPMCSTFKLLAVGAVLRRIDEGRDELDRTIRFTQKDIVTSSPATEKRVASGMSIQQLCAAAITLSDNTAANLLLASIGGPPGLTVFARTLGDEVTRLDRIEPELNESLPGDPRDTSTPDNMLSDLRELVLGNALSRSSRSRLTDWLVQNKTGDKRLRAGVPAGWKVGDKTGSGAKGTTNDLAILWPPQCGPILVAVYLTDTAADDDHRSGTIAAVGAAVAAADFH
jgi:beta-lactamase class A